MTATGLAILKGSGEIPKVLFEGSPERSAGVQERHAEKDPANRYACVGSVGW